MKPKIVILASGNGTNAENIIKYFQATKTAEVVQVLSNKKDAKVLARAQALNVSARSFTKDQLNSKEILGKMLEEINPDLIVLAGFLLKIPEYLVADYPDKIINIHPALLPDYGGKGMYGMHVHKAVVENKESFSGITIHYVNEHYDEGGIIFQAKTRLDPSDSPEDVAAKIHKLEYEHFPKVLENLILAH